jgi:multiple sugar transport system substrate-binding protein
VIAISYHVQKQLFGKNKWLDDIRPMMYSRSPTRTRFRRLREGGLNYATQADGRVDSLPLNLDPWVVYYNKELFDAKNIRIEDIRPEMIDAAAKLNDPSKGVSGFVARGLKGARPVASSFLLGYGGVRRRQRQAHPETAEAIDAAKMFQVLLAKYGPRRDFWRNESQSLFLQGKPMWLDGIEFAQPSKALVAWSARSAMASCQRVETAGVSAFRRQRRHFDVQQEKKGPSWFYLQWASNKMNQTRMQAAAGAPVRNSAYAAAQSSADFKAPKQWVECMLTSARIAQPGLPVIAPVTEFRDVFGIALTNMINGADPAAEMKKATAEFQPVLDKSEKG